MSAAFGTILVLSCAWPTPCRSAVTTLSSRAWLSRRLEEVLLLKCQRRRPLISRLEGSGSGTWSFGAETSGEDIAVASYAGFAPVRSYNPHTAENHNPAHEKRSPY